MPDGSWVQTGPAFTYVDEHPGDWIEREYTPHETGTDDPIDFPKYEPDDGPLTEAQVEQIRETAKDDLPSGEVLLRETLFPYKVKEFVKVWKENDQSAEDDSPIGPEAVIDPQSATVTDTYVQNEEQAESNIWTKATGTITQEEYIAKSLEKKPEQDREEDHVTYLAANVRAGRMHMNEIPLSLVDRVKARL